MARTRLFVLSTTVSLLALMAPLTSAPAARAGDNVHALGTLGKGYWLAANDGGIFSFGDAKFKGSTGAITLNKPIVGIAVDLLTGGYWLVASDGGIFAFSAPYFGSTGGMTLNSPIVAMTATLTGKGYLL